MGRKPKQKRNVSGLRNQPKAPSPPLQLSPTPEPIPESRKTRVEDMEEDFEWSPQTRFDSFKPNWDEEDGSLDEEESTSSLDGDIGAVEEWDEWNELAQDGLHVNLMKLAIENGDDPRDEDWVPQSLRRMRKKMTSQLLRPREYMKGPDLASKSDRTRRRYRALLRDQMALDTFGFTVGKTVRCTEDVANEEDHLNSPSPSEDSPEKILWPEEPLSPIRIRKHSATPPVSRRDPTPVRAYTPVPVREESLTPPPLLFDDVRTPLRPSTPIRQEAFTPEPLSFDPPNPPWLSTPIREESVTPPPLLFDTPNLRKRSHNEIDDGTESVLDEKDAEDKAEEEDPWEDELRETLKAQVEIRGWKLLRDQIKADLKKHHSSLPLSQMNQLMILRNFATLRLKGVGKVDASQEIAKQWHEKSEGSSAHFSRRIRALARHYQIFEQLPVECRGGSKNARSLLKDETVRTAARTWLTEQAIGSITPQNFAYGLNSVILPSLNVNLRKPLCERTARRWLVTSS